MTREEMCQEPGSDRWRDRLSEYLDGELPPRERLEVEAHLTDCGACREALEGLRRVVREASTLKREEEPAGDLWPGVRVRLRPRSSRWGWLGALVALPGGGAWWRPAFAAAGLVLVVAAGLLLLPRGGAPPPAPAGEPPRAGAPAAAPPLEARPVEASREYYDTLARLRLAARASLAHDPRVVEVLEQNLEVLDIAIAQYSDALADQPGDEALASRLAAARQRKIEVLRQAVDLAAEAGN